MLLARLLGALLLALACGSRDDAGRLRLRLCCSIVAPLVGVIPLCVKRLCQSSGVLVLVRHLKMSSL